MYLLKLRHWTQILTSIMSFLLLGQQTINPLPASIGTHSWGWKLIGPTGGEYVMDVDVDLQHPMRLYAATGNGIYRSTDRGSTWNLCLEGIFRALVIDPNNSDIIYTGPSFYKSTDGGDTWTNYVEGMTCNNLATLAISATNPSIIYTGSF